MDTSLEHHQAKPAHQLIGSDVLNVFWLLITVLIKKMCSTTATSRTDYAIPDGTSHCTTCHLLLTKRKNYFCTWWGWLSSEVFFVDSSFNGVKWETLTYLGKGQWKFFFLKISYLSITRCASTQYESLGCTKCLIFLNLYSNMLVHILKLLLHLVAM